MKRIYSLLFALFFITTSILSQTSVPGGLVYGNWSLSGSPYQVQGSVQIPNDSTLTIEPGVVVEFQGAYKLIVMGKLIAVGTQTDSITITALNTSTGWKGIRIENTTNNNDSTKIKFCKLLYGKATTTTGNDGNGGGVMARTFSKVVISNSRFSFCEAIYGGGAVACLNGSNIKVLSNKITNNIAAMGAGVYATSSNPTISYNTIAFNTAIGGTGSGQGGGIGTFFNTANPTISYNYIFNNTANEGGGIYCYNGSRPTISNNVICNNEAPTNAGRGGGICFHGLSGQTQWSTLTNNTIANNKSKNGGGIYCWQNVNPTIRNGIILGNTATISGNNIYLDDDGCDPNIYYTNLEGGSAGIETNGNIYLGTYQNNINSNPMFVAPSAGSGNTFDGLNADWQLQSGSPSIDTGDPTMVTQSIDVAGNPRINICRIDQGAYEYQSGIPLAGTITVSSPILCNGYTNGELVVTATGSGAPYTYLWSPGGSTNDTLSNIGANTYTVVVSNSTGCSKSVTFTLTQPAGMSLSLNDTDIDCSGSCDGTATVNVSGGSGSFTYSWNSAPVQTTAIATGLCSGAYTVTVTDVPGGCTSTGTVSITTPSLLTSNATLDNITCYNLNNGQIHVTASGGTAPLKYSIDGGLNFQFPSNFIGLAPGTYTVITMDDNGCQTSPQTITITEPTQFNITTTQNNVHCYGGNTGSAIVSGSGGTPPYTYSWNTTPTSNNDTVTGLSIGNYIITANDANSCNELATVQIVSSLPQIPICVVTVDSLSNFNEIYWDKTPIGGAADTFLVYRDTANNNYALIGKVAYDSLSFFIDTIRTLYNADGNPNVSSWRYKIATMDTCGFISPMSDFHQTMFIQNSSGNFSWNHYQIEGQVLPVVTLSNYLFKRDDFSTGNFVTIQTLSASSTAYTDPQYGTYASTGSWRTFTQWTNSCLPTRGAINTSRSNVKSPTSIGIANPNTILSQIELYPNPAKGQVTINLSNELARNKTTLKMYNTLGQLILENELSSISNLIDVNSISSGVYTILIQTSNESANLKLIVE